MATTPAVRPTVSVFTWGLYRRLPRFLRTADEAQGWPLLTYLALLGDQAEVLASVIRSGPARLADPATADARALPWLARLAGVDPTVYPNPAGDVATGGRFVDYAALRAAILYADDTRASGSTKAVLSAVRPLLSATRTADIVTRDPVAFSYTVRVYEREVPDVAAVLAALEATRPAALRAYLLVAPGQTWGDVADRGITLGALGSFTNDQVRTAVPGQPITT